ERQEGLDRFLQRIIHHSELVDAPCLLPFFTANPNDWKEAQEKAKLDESLMLTEDDSEDPNSIKIDAHAAMHQPAEEKKRGRIGKWFTAKRDQWALQKKNLNLEETPAEAKKFGDIQEYADHLEVCTRILREDYQEMLRNYVTMADKYQSMGAAFAQLWGEHELSSTSSATLYQTLGQTWAQVSKRIEARIGSGKRYFANPVEDLLMDVTALKEALGKRKASLYSLTKAMQEGQNLQQQMDKLRNSADFSGQQDRYYALEKDIRRNDLTVEEMKKHCTLVTSRLGKDVERFRVEWHERMRQVLEDFHKQQIEFLQTQSMEFSSALPALSSLDSGRSQLPTAPTPVAKTEINMSYNSSGAKPSLGATSIPVDQGESFPEAAPPAAAPPLPPAVAPPPLPPPADEADISIKETTSLDSVDMSDLAQDLTINENSGAVMTSL
ncbi:MAG: hypothetical protein SGILL_002039, partial [Bacillariaceae sp.]